MLLVECYRWFWTCYGTFTTYNGSFQDEVLFNSWEDMLNGAGGPFNHGASIYSFDGNNVKDDPKW